jgi:hypothetical protein
MFSPSIISLLVLVALFGAAMLGLSMRSRLPDHHLSESTKDTVRIGMGSIATMSALVLGLLVASTKGAYDTERNEVIQLAAKVGYLDQMLLNYGPEAESTRAVLKRAMRSTILRIWPEVEGQTNTIVPTKLWTQELPRAIQHLPATTDEQRTFRSQAAELANELGQLRWLLFEQSDSSVSAPLLVMMVFWLALTFMSVGLFAPRNATVIITQFMAALSVAGALFLILELDQPFSGVIRISNRPMTNALEQLGK